MRRAWRHEPFADAARRLRARRLRVPRCPHRPHPGTQFPGFVCVVGDTNHICAGTYPPLRRDLHICAKTLNHDCPYPRRMPCAGLLLRAPWCRVPRCPRRPRPGTSSLGLCLRGVGATHPISAGTCPAFAPGHTHLCARTCTSCAKTLNRDCPYPRRDGVALNVSDESNPRRVWLVHCKLALHSSGPAPDAGKSRQSERR
jgi:hypothetical protein